jgi:hypothetical protein
MSADYELPPTPKNAAVVILGVLWLAVAIGCTFLGGCATSSGAMGYQVNTNTWEVSGVSRAHAIVGAARLVRTAGLPAFVIRSERTETAGAGGTSVCNKVGYSTICSGGVSSQTTTQLAVTGLTTQEKAAATAAGTLVYDVDVVLRPQVVAASSDQSSYSASSKKCPDAVTLKKLGAQAEELFPGCG